INFESNIPRKVSLEFGDNQGLSDFKAAAAAIFLVDLTPSSSPLAAVNMTLDRFAANLEAMARLDKLSPSVDCFKAINGLHSSLIRLFEHEVRSTLQIMNDGADEGAEKAGREVMCKKSGRPRMHARGRFGLAVEYWLSRRRVKPALRQSPPSRVETEQPATKDHSQSQRDQTNDDDRIYSLHIEAQTCSSMHYPPLRISDAWIADRVEKPPGESMDAVDIMSDAPGIDWLEPAPNYASSKESPQAQRNGGMDLDAIGGDVRLPDIRFVAKLDPPLVVPWHVATRVLNAVGVTIEQPVLLPPTYENMLLGRDAQAGSANGSLQQIKAEKLAVAKRDGVFVDARHENSLHYPKPDFARTLDEIPFSHPRQIVEILPTLRQWAFIGSLLREAFTLNKDDLELQQSTNHTAQASLDNTNKPPPPPRNLFPTQPHKQPKPPSPSHPSSVSISLTTSTHVPTLSLSFPLGTEIAQIAFEVAPNAELKAVDRSAMGSSRADVRRLAAMLEACEDVGVWIEFVRSRYGW
ncbi:hypothetical protein LTR66_012399, partial [Elasticomyces elasticus]